MTKKLVKEFLRIKKFSKSYVIYHLIVDSFMQTKKK